MITIYTRIRVLDRFKWLFPWSRSPSRLETASSPLFPFKFYLSHRYDKCVCRHRVAALHILVQRSVLYDTLSTLIPRQTDPAHRYWGYLPFVDLLSRNYVGGNRCRKRIPLTNGLSMRPSRGITSWRNHNQTDSVSGDDSRCRSRFRVMHQLQRWQGEDLGSL